MSEATRNLRNKKPNNLEIFRKSMIDAIAKSMRAFAKEFL